MDAALSASTYSPAQSAPRVLWRDEDDSWDIYDDQACTKKVGSSTVGMSVTLSITRQSVMRGQAPELGGFRACPIIRPGGPVVIFKACPSEGVFIEYGGCSHECRWKV